MPSLRELLSIDRASRNQRRARALVEADRALLRSLVEVRRSRGLTQKQVAERLGISQASVASFERYDNDPKLSTVRRYAHAVEALVAHAIEADNGQLETPDHTLVVVMKPVVMTGPTLPSLGQRVVSASRGDFALVA